MISINHKFVDFADIGTISPLNRHVPVQIATVIVKVNKN